ncbi:division/cell wall cluster transcriptional repressor MraZ [Patescibacteria group bacterium]|nr:division/cell wall cluster transcriptional repressor MraZ [Patescibacteria group bacterium]MBU1727826.1 division/cell wall cluster transcriptional repressor MraZ [Patescibacteria group bacterium]
MLIGEYIHTIDEKNRISLPVKFRQEMGKKVVMTRGLDKCLFIFTIKEWNKISADLSALPWLKADARAFNRRIFGGATEIEVDTVGRMLIPEFLKSEANLAGASKAVLVGVDNRVELWNEKIWSEYKNEAEKRSDEIAEKLGTAGK